MTFFSLSILFISVSLGLNPARSSRQDRGKSPAELKGMGRTFKQMCVGVSGEGGHAVLPWEVQLETRMESEAM